MISHLRLPYELRKELATPLGTLYPGTPEQVAPLLSKEFSEQHPLVVTVGDVVSEMLVEVGFSPNLIITDGFTKRSELETKLEVDGYDIKAVENPAGEISAEAWHMLRNILHNINQETRIHLVVDGEEDLLVLPIMLELPENTDARIVYGQPNEGAVVLDANLSMRFLIEDIISRMETVSHAD